jgi:hypothetical protein
MPVNFLFAAFVSSTMPDHVLNSLNGPWPGFYLLQRIRARRHSKTQTLTFKKVGFQAAAHSDCLSVTIPTHSPFPISHQLQISQIVNLNKLALEQTFCMGSASHLK